MDFMSTYLHNNSGPIMYQLIHTNIHYYASIFKYIQSEKHDTICASYCSVHFTNTNSADSHKL